MTEANTKLRSLPSVDRVLQELNSLVDEYGHERLSQAVRQELDKLRDKVKSGVQVTEEDYLAYLTQAVSENLSQAEQRSLIPVFNLSGTVLHTNLGRALLPESAIDAVRRVASSASNLEYDLEQGGRGDRDTHIEELVCELSGAEAATVVNNNAAAVLLALNTLGKGRQVPVSRGELVEIGGSFRMPEIISSSGCMLVEIGTTNRTHLKDYRSAINEHTALLLKVHTSNYRIEGFVREVEERQLAELAHEFNLPFVIDLGSGNFLDFGSYGLPEEPTVRQALESGADLVTFSGDKLLGGPQCGIVAGRKDHIDAIKSNPLKRALRLDKMTLAALAEVLHLYRNPAKLKQALPTLNMLTRPMEEIRQQAEGLQKILGEVLGQAYQCASRECSSQVGSGALPTTSIPSYALAINPVDGNDESLRKLSRLLRALPVPVIGRIHNGSIILDLRCLVDEPAFVDQLDILKDALA